jgi:hypothetical protein
MLPSSRLSCASAASASAVASLHDECPSASTAVSHRLQPTSVPSNCTGVECSKKRRERRCQACILSISMGASIKSYS